MYDKCQMCFCKDVFEKMYFYLQINFIKKKFTNAFPVNPQICPIVSIKQEHIGVGYCHFRDVTVSRCFRLSGGVGSSPARPCSDGWLGPSIMTGSNMGIRIMKRGGLLKNVQRISDRNPDPRLLQIFWRNIPTMVS